MPKLTCSKCRQSLDSSQFTKLHQQKRSQDERKCKRCIVGRAFSSSKESSKHEQEEDSDGEITEDDEGTPPKVAPTIAAAARALLFLQFKDSLFPPSKVEVYFRAIKQMNEKLRK